MQLLLFIISYAQNNSDRDCLCHWSGAGIILISAIGWIFYKQHLDLAACIGLALMIAGIVIINVFSKTPIYKI